MRIGSGSLSDGTKPFQMIETTIDNLHHVQVISQVFSNIILIHSLLYKYPILKDIGDPYLGVVRADISDDYFTIPAPSGNQGSHEITAGSNNNLLLIMASSRAEKIYVAEICDYGSEPQSSSQMQCNACRSGYFASNIQDYCQPCSKVNAYEYYTRYRLTRMRLLCDITDETSASSISKIIIFASIGLVMLCLISSICILIIKRWRRLQFTRVEDISNNHRGTCSQHKLYTMLW
ncbi:hypothetical protein FGO68_gene10645 [Halteria grandinella]|uniref:Tyrosine-protein kinase ephrin type A/B receptor-like domain-containing protein n=1 Tax=Halteria grandinella TaxID=5974 RepID=A0A8J8NUT9_HALGN|nr:hypothetical protein FGO68_gene10645 [Halteria grandinella]